MPISRTNVVAAARSFTRVTQSTSVLIRDAVVSPGGYVTCVMDDGPELQIRDYPVLVSDASLLVPAGRSFALVLLGAPLPGPRLRSCYSARPCRAPPAGYGKA